MGMVVSLLYSWLFGKTTSKVMEPHDSPVLKSTAAAISINMYPGACKSLLKEEEMKDENAVKVSSQGKVHALLLSNKVV
jgi:hypothetical protein